MAADERRGKADDVSLCLPVPWQEKRDLQLDARQIEENKAQGPIGSCPFRSSSGSADLDLALFATEGHFVCFSAKNLFALPSRGKFSTGSSQGQFADPYFGRP